MNDFDTRLATSLRERADGADVPALALPEILERGDARRRTTKRRNGWLAAGAAAAVVTAIALPIALTGGGTEQAPPVSPPSDSRSVEPEGIGLPYILDGVLHVGTERISTSLGDLATGGGEVFVSWDSEDGSHWRRLVDGELVDTPYIGLLSVSAEGDRVVSYEWDAERSFIILWEVGTDRVLEEIEIPHEGTETAVDVLGFDGAGRVFWQVDDDLRMLKLTGEVVTVTGLPEARNFELSPLGPVASARSGDRLVVGSTTEDGRFEQVGELPVVDIGPSRWSADGRAAWVAGGELVVGDPVIGDQSSYPLPKGPFEVEGWDGTDAVIVLADQNGGGTAIRVDLTSGETTTLFENTDYNWAFPMR